MNNAVEYAKALYELKDDLFSREEFLADLKEVTKIFKNDILRFFLHPGIEKEKKKEIIIKDFSKRDIRDFLLVLVDNDRMSILSDIVYEFECMVEEEKKMLKVIVYSKEKLEDSYLSKLKEKLEKKISKKIFVINKLDENIRGGNKIVYDSKEIDLTLNTKFSNLVEKLKE